MNKFNMKINSTGNGLTGFYCLEKVSSFLGQLIILRSSLDGSEYLLKTTTSILASVWIGLSFLAWNKIHKEIPMYILQF